MTINVRDDIDDSLYTKAIAEWCESPIEDRKVVLDLLATVIAKRKSVIAASSGEQSMAALCKGMAALGAAFEILEHTTSRRTVEVWA